MTSTAQMALRRIMEKYTANTRFCIIANYTHKLSPALLSRCTRFRFSPLKEADIRSLIDKVIEKENVNIQPEAVDSLVTLSKGDMRRALNVLQACHASSMSLSLGPTRISSLTKFQLRYTAAIEKRPQRPTTTRARGGDERNDIRLHCGAASIGYPGNHVHVAFYQRCHILSQHPGHDQGQQGSCPGGYPLRSGRTTATTGGACTNENHMAGGTGRDGMATGRGRVRDHADRGLGWSSTEWV